VKRAGAAIRRAGTSDLDALTALWLECAADHAAFEPLFTLRPGAEACMRRVLAAQLADLDAAFFVHESAGGIDGFCSARIDRAPPIHPETLRAEITDVSVRAASRRRGIGRALVAAALEWARAREVARIEVRVVSGNALGQQFWRALGFDAFVDVLHRRL
jgi:GNAT superfamily N-acetyltransferase